MVNTEHNADNKRELTADSKKCMHCGQIGAYPFCVGGGALPITGTSRSYCYQSFKVLALQEQRLNIELSKEQSFVLANTELFTDWLKGLPRVETNEV